MKYSVFHKLSFTFSDFTDGKRPQSFQYGLQEMTFIRRLPRDHQKYYSEYQQTGWEVQWSVEIRVSDLASQFMMQTRARVEHCLHYQLRHRMNLYIPTRYLKMLHVQMPLTVCLFHIFSRHLRVTIIQMATTVTAASI